MTTQPATRVSSRWWLRLAVVFLGATAIWLALGFFSGLIFGPGYSYASHIVRACGTIALVLPLLSLVLRWEGVPAKNYGLLPDRQTPANAGIGALGYLLPFAATGIVVVMLGAAAFTVSGTPIELIGQLLAVLVLILLYEAIPEELIFRGYFFATLRERFPAWVAVVGQMVLFCLFGVVIGAVQTADRLLLFALFSLSLGIIRAATGSVFVTVGFHTAFQFSTQPVLGPQWPAISLDDPERWFSDFAYGLAPAILGPVVVILLMKLLRKRPS